MRSGKSYTQNAIELFQRKLGKIVTSEELAQLTGADGKPISHNIRRIFELRDEKGYNIINHRDNQRTGLNLKVDEWILLDLEPNLEKIKNRGVNKRIRFEVFERDHYTCQCCGRDINDEDPINQGQKIVLHVGHKIAHKRNSPEYDFNNKELCVDDFITMCSVCNEGAKNTDIKKYTLLDRVKESDLITQKEIFNYLKNKLI